MRRAKKLPIAKPLQGGPALIASGASFVIIRSMIKAMQEAICVNPSSSLEGIDDAQIVSNPDLDQTKDAITP
jgi:hypothetical protein